MDGLEASRQIKEMSELSPKPTIIMATAYGSEELMNKAEAEGIAAFLMKPISASAMLDVIMQTVAASGERRARRRQGKAIDDAVKHLRGARILLVEDNELNQQVASELLESAGFVVEQARDGIEALDKMNSSFHAVLMDIQMPRLDGYEATRRIREHEDWKEIPIIAMTANALESDRAEALAAGMTNHVAKPINPEQLYAILARCIKVDPAKPFDVLPESSSAETGHHNTAVELPMALPGIDIEDGLMHLAGKPEAYRRLLLAFPEGQGETAEAIRQAKTKGDWDTAIRLAHSLKSVAGNLGARALRQMAQEAESALKEAAKDGSDTSSERNAVLGIDAMETGLRLVCEGIESWRGKSGSPTSRAAVADKSQGLADTQIQGLSELERLISESDGRALRVCEELLPQASGELLMRLERVGSLLSRFDYDKAHAVLKGEK